MGRSGFLVAEGPNGVPHLIYLDYGANTESSTTVGPPESSTQRGCWVITDAF
jgi:hypothetical protein